MGFASVTRTFSKTVTKSKQAAPTFWFVAGVAGVVGSTVLACKATRKLDTVLETHEERMAEVRVSERSGSPEEAMKSKQTAVAETAVDVVKLYGPSVILGVVSIAALTGSHTMLKNRNKELGVALAAATKAYSAYRNRVRDEIGEERESMLHQGYTGVVSAKKIGDPVGFNDPMALNPYRHVFDETCVDWVHSVEMNRLFLQAQQEHWNHKLRTRGHVFLNEILTSLGIEHTSAGALAGWVWNNEGGDNFIDFGLYTLSENIKAWEGDPRVIYLDFNVDGPIWDKI